MIKYPKLSYMLYFISAATGLLCIASSSHSLIFGFIGCIILFETRKEILIHSELSPELTTLMNRI